MCRCASPRCSLTETRVPHGACVGAGGGQPSLASSRDAWVTCQHPGSPGCPQQVCPSAIRLHRFRSSLVSFSPNGIGWSMFVRKSLIDGRLFIQSFLSPRPLARPPSCSQSALHEQASPSCAGVRWMDHAPAADSTAATPKRQVGPTGGFRSRRKGTNQPQPFVTTQLE
jgi:hypothetical protein